MKLSLDEFFYLKNELNVTPLMTGEGLRFIKSTHPQLYHTSIGKKDDGIALITENCFIFSLKNETLNKFICEKFEEPLENLYMIHRLIYGIGGHAKRHKDRFTTHKTVSLLLSDNFEGGEMFINDIEVELYKTGDFICFNGSKDFHEIKKITSGYREVLIVWFSKKQTKTLI